MSLKAAFMVPHPPLIIKEIGLGREKEIIKTQEAYEKVAEEIKKLKPDTIIISSPHTLIYSNGFYISSGNINKGSFKNFGAENVCFEEKIDNQLVDEIEKITKEKYRIPIARKENIELDHGTMVPLYFIRKKIKDTKIIVIGLSGLSLADHYRFGMLLEEVINKSKKNIVYVASGDLSHKLKEYGPYGYAKEGPEYDKRIMDVCRNARFLELLKFNPTFLNKAAECGHRSFTIMAGVMDKTNVDSKEYSHEDVTGVGYGICSFYPKDKNEDRNYYEQYIKQEEEKIHSNDELVNLAKNTIENYILNEKIIDIPKDISKKYIENKAGVFVSIHKFGELRGCIGTFLPVTNSIAEEIIRNAISASTDDPRFDKITSDELKYLEINVDILSEPKEIKSIEELNPKKYGIIVYSGYKRGLLLPDLEGIDTIEQQIDIAKKKGNIEENEEINIEKFEVIRHK